MSKPYYERDGIVLYCGDNREVLPELAPHSISAVVTDPPYGLSFMGRDWDHAVPGIPYWQAIAAVMKPGAHLLSFGGDRTMHRVMTAIEDAGLDIRTQLAWLFGSGFPKSRSMREIGRPELGTALKPAMELICMARKPFASTVAANVLRHGCGAINVDACRIETDDNLNGGAYAKNPTERDNWVNKTRPGDENSWRRGGAGEYTQPKGRWPSNVLLDESAAALLDAQSGERKSGGSPASCGGGSRHTTPGWGLKATVAPGYHDTGGASRFFTVVEQDAPCLACGHTYAPKHDIMNVTQEVTACDHANIAATTTSPSDPIPDSALGSVLEPQPHASGGNSQSNNGYASIAESSSASTPQTRIGTAGYGAWVSLTESLVPRVRSAANLCDSCVTDIAQSLAAMLLGQTPVSRPGLDSITGFRGSTLRQNLASFAEPMVNTGIIPTTASLSILFGSVRHAINESITTAKSDTFAGSVPSRLKYSPKASRRERNAGLEGMPERMVHRAGHGNNEPDHGTQKFVTNMQNHHPTVKPLALMEWLIRLVTPPGGIVLDPFAGSGTTGVAAARLGIPCVMIEMSEEYCEIIARRIDHALDERANAVTQLGMVAD